MQISAGTDTERTTEATGEWDLDEPPVGEPALDASRVWDATARHLRKSISDGHFTAWFGAARPVGLRADTFVLELPNGFTHGWVQQRYMDVLADSLRRAAGRPLDVQLEIAPDGSASVDPPPEPELAPVDPQRRTDGSGSPAADFHPKYTFDSFVTGSSNQFARAAALAVAEAPARAYNPLFIYGDSGLGKTHLLHAIGHYVNECHPDRTVRYVSTERFVNEFISALQRGTIADFHRVYRVADVLLVDDIQFLEGKERTQEEFFHTFNELHPRSQIVITSDRPPKKISTLEERLRTRFEWGLLADVQPPDLETRLAILNKKAESDGLRLPPNVMAFIADRVQTNIRELEGALIRVAAYASLTRAPVTLELAQEVLQSLLPGGAKAPVTADLIISVTADYFDVTTDELKTGNRSRPLVTARQMAMYLCRELTDLSFPQIGRRFGGKDHSTVHYAVEKISKQLPERATCYQQAQELTARIRQQAARG